MNMQNFTRKRICFFKVIPMFLLLFSLFSCSKGVSISSKAYPYRLAICAMFKNEAPWLEEWLLYHHKVLGVEHFYLYNNDSSDGYKEVLQPFITQGIVELIDWSSEDPTHKISGAFMDAPWNMAQIGAYNDCLKNRALNKTKWVAMIDIDEFIVPVKGVKSFYKLLERAEKKRKGAVSLYWRMFGTSDVEDLKEGELLVEKLILRARDGYPSNQRVKSIYRPERVVSCWIHIAEKLQPHYGSITLHPEEVRIHHYWCRTKRFCLEKRKMSPLSHPDIFQELHQVEDRTMLQYLPLLKECRNDFEKRKK